MTFFFVVVGWVRGIAPKYRRRLEKVNNWRGVIILRFFFYAMRIFLLTNRSGCVIYREAEPGTSAWSLRAPFYFRSMRGREMRYEEISELFELRGDELWRKARVSPNGYKMKEKLVENTGARPGGYTDVNINGRREKYHRIVKCLELRQDLPPGIQIDHRDGIPINSLADNLRLVTDRENKHNLAKHRAGKKVGGSFKKRRGKWEAQIKINDKSRYLGRYDTEQEMHETYMRAFAMVQALPTVFSRDIPAGLLRSVVRDDTGLVKLFCRDLRKDLTNGFGYDILRLATSR